MEWYLQVLLGIGGIIVVFFLCRWIIKSSADTEQKWRERRQLRRWNRYIIFLDPSNEQEIFRKLKNSTDTEFNEFLNSIKPILKYRYIPNKMNEPTLLKRSLYNVVNRFTDEFEYNRLKSLEKALPLLKRVYFGFKLTKKVYSKDNLKRKFTYQLQSGSEIPKLDTIIDVAFFFNTTVNKILGLCYMQEKKHGYRFIKRERIYKNLKNEQEESSQDLDPITYLVDPSHYIPEVKGKSIKNQLIPVILQGVIQENENPTDPSFHELSSPFYKRKFLLKPDGRKRLIASPVSYLKKYQKMILEQILEKAQLPNSCTGFVKNRSIITNAQNHVGSQTLVKIDLKDFFNSLKFHHAFEVFRGFGYNRAVSGILACICTDWYTIGGRYVPQGAPSSPMIGNLYTKHLDKRLEGLWSKNGFSYSRYADDLTFSSPLPKIAVRGLIYATNQIIRDENLYPNFAKTKVYRKQHKKSVTGITVNEKININRKWMNNYRGELYRYSIYGLPFEKTLSNKIFHQLKGKFAFLKMVNPEKAEKYRPYLEKIEHESSLFRN